MDLNRLLRFERDEQVICTKRAKCQLFRMTSCGNSDTIRTWWEPDMRLNRSGRSSNRTRRSRHHPRPHSCTLFSRSTVDQGFRLSDKLSHAAHPLNRGRNWSSDTTAPAALVREPAPDIDARRAPFNRRVLLLVVMARVATIYIGAPPTSTNIAREAPLGVILIPVHRAGRVRPGHRPRLVPPSSPRTDPRARAVVKVRARPIQETMSDDRAVRRPGPGALEQVARAPVRRQALDLLHELLMRRRLGLVRAPLPFRALALLQFALLQFALLQLEPALLLHDLLLRPRGRTMARPLLRRQLYSRRFWFRLWPRG